METEPASRFSPTTRLNDFSAAFTFKLHKLAMKLPPSLTRLWTRRPKILPARDESVVRSSAAAPEVDAIPCFASATLGIRQVQVRGSDLDPGLTLRLTHPFHFSVFRLPDELFLEVLANFPVLQWSDLYYHYSHPFQYTPIPGVYGERVQTLLALSATCRTIRHTFPLEVLMYLKRWLLNHQSRKSTVSDTPQPILLVKSYDGRAGMQWKPYL